MSTREVVLPSGKFATLSAPTTGQVLIAYTASKGYLPLTLSVLAEMCVKIDGEKISAPDFLATPAEEFGPVVRCLLRAIDDFEQEGVA